MKWITHLELNWINWIWHLSPLSFNQRKLTTRNDISKPRAVTLKLKKYEEESNAYPSVSIRIQIRIVLMNKLEIRTPALFSPVFVDFPSNDKYCVLIYYLLNYKFYFTNLLTSFSTIFPCIPVVSTEVLTHCYSMRNI